MKMIEEFSEDKISHLYAIMIFVLFCLESKLQLSAEDESFSATSLLGGGYKRFRDHIERTKLGNEHSPFPQFRYEYFRTDPSSNRTLTEIGTWKKCTYI